MFRFIFFSLCALGLSGCGGSKATIEGTVSYEGQPIQNGNISFQPTDGKGNSAGSPIKDGKYRVTDALPGPKTVFIQAVKAASGPVSSADLQRAAEQNPGQAPESNELVPAKAVGNNVKFDVVAGKQTKDFALQKPTGN